MKIIVNYDLKHVAEIDKALANNDGYCPCVLEKNEDTKCMCKAFKEQKEEGPCHCGRFIKIKE